MFNGEIYLVEVVDRGVVVLILAKRNPFHGKGSREVRRRSLGKQQWWLV
jgi:hypothetical protein